CYLFNTAMAFYFFFQAEDGIRYFHVTGVQTCALPISWFLAQRVVVEIGKRFLLQREFDINDLLDLRQEPGVDLGELVHVFQREEIGRASCRERELLSVVDLVLQKKMRFTVIKKSVGLM